MWVITVISDIRSMNNVHLKNEHISIDRHANCLREKRGSYYCQNVAYYNFECQNPLAKEAK
jgi:hypothetical protein